MSRAFIKEDAGDPDELPERHQSASPNYVTPEGLAALRQKALELRAQLESLPKDGMEARQTRRDLHYYDGRTASAILVDPRAGPEDEVRFGAFVDLHGGDGKTRRVAVVGQDEAEGAAGKISWDSTLAMALMGMRVGEWVDVEGPGVLTIAGISYPGRQRK